MAGSITTEGSSAYFIGGTRITYFGPNSFPSRKCDVAPIRFEEEDGGDGGGGGIRLGSPTTILLRFFDDAEQLST
jgi:hypothetical protein